MKIIKISICTHCGECNHHFMSQLSENITYCLHEDNQYDVSTGGDPIIPDFPHIPDWCPLEDNQDLTPALDILQKCINRGDSLKKWKDGTYKLSGLEGVIVEGKTIKELLVNLVKLKEKGL